MSDLEDFEMEQTKPSVTKTSLTFLLEGIDPRDLAADGLSLLDFPDSDSETGGGVREAPTCQELAIEGESLTKQGEHKEAIPLLESALEMGTDDLQLLSALWSLLGNAHFYLGNYDKAAQCHAHDLAICNELGDERNQAQAYCNLGIANRKTGYLQRAKLCYERYLDICEKLEDSRSKSKAHHNLGDLHLTLARLKLQKEGAILDNSPEVKEHLEKAAESFERHLEYVRERQSKSAEARVHASLGYVYELLKNTDKAIDHYEQRLRISAETSDRGAEGRSYCSIGNCLRSMIQPEKAIECYTRSISIATELNDKVGEGVVHCNMAMTYEMLCNLEQALEHHEKHLEAMRSEEDLYGQAMALTNIAKTYEYMANLSKACETLESLTTVQKQQKQDGELIDTLSRLARLNELRGEKTPKSGGTGLKNTWKKLKGKKKKQRNLTAPEISTHFLESDASTGSASPGRQPLAPLKESESFSGGGLFSKQSASKDKVKKQDSSSKISPKNKRRHSLSNKEEIHCRTDSPSSIEDASLSQKSDSRFSDEHTPPLRRSKTDQLLYDQSDLSQTSKLSPSQSGTFMAHEEQLSTQSSSDVQVSPMHHPMEGKNQEVILSEFLPNGHLGEEGTIEEVSREAEEERDFRKGCDTMYAEFGDKTHKLNLRKVEKFLESSGEMEPNDLGIIRDWDGWALASKEIVISTSHESQLI